MHTPDRSDQFNANRATAGEPEANDATLAELRGDLAALVADVKRVVDARTASAQQAAHIGLDFTRDTIRTNPVAALAIAAVAGAGLAMLVVPASRPSRRFSNMRDWAPQLTRADLHDMVGNLQRTATRATAGTPLMSVFERVVDSVSSIDPKTSLTPALEKAGAWLGSLRSAMAGK